MKEKREKESIHADHRQRMRERIAHGGIEGLSDHEVLEYLLYPFIPRKDTNVIAHELIERFSSLDGVAHATPAMLRQIKGITENAVLFLSCMTDIGDRCRKSRAFSVYFRDSFTVAQYAFELFGGVREERVYIVCLGGSAKTVASVLLARGDEIACDVPEELVLASVTGNKTKSAYLLHNHVGDSALPSHRDAEFTSCVKELLSGAGVTLNDHIIISDKSFYSFKFNGLL